jgi:hypothetical protein
MTLKTKRRAEDFEELLAVSREELLRRGALSVLTERIWQLRERVHQLAERHGSLAALSVASKPRASPPMITRYITIGSSGAPRSMSSIVS